MSPAAADKLTSILFRHSMTQDLRDELVALRDEIAKPVVHEAVCMAVVDGDDDACDCGATDG